MLYGLLINNLRTRRLPGKALQPGKVTWFSAETLWQIQHRYASVHGTGKIPGKYRLPGARAGTVTPELEQGRREEFSGRASLQYCAPFQGWTGWSFAWGKEAWAFTTHQSFC